MKNNYREVDTCANCAFRFVKSEYDGFHQQHYCTFDAPPRPLCGSVLLGESFGNYAERDKVSETRSLEALVRRKICK